jgi:hypothetical protein
VDPWRVNRRPCGSSTVSELSLPAFLPATTWKTREGLPVVSPDADAPSTRGGLPGAPLAPPPEGRGVATTVHGEIANGAATCLI